MNEKEVQELFEKARQSITVAEMLLREGFFDFSVRVNVIQTYLLGEP